MLNRPTRFYSKKQEKKVAGELNMQTTPNSGATPWVKGDLIDSNVVIECKTKMNKTTQITIKKEWLETLKEEQFQMGKDISALVFDFGCNPQYAILDMMTFKNLLECWRELHNEE